MQDKHIILAAADKIETIYEEYWRKKVQKMMNVSQRDTVQSIFHRAPMSDFHFILKK
jgi:hypothetical protein